MLGLGGTLPGSWLPRVTIYDLQGGTVQSDPPTAGQGPDLGIPDVRDPVFLWSALSSGNIFLSALRKFSCFRVMQCRCAGWHV